MFVLLFAALSFHALTVWIAAHPAITGWIITSLVAIYRSRTPAQWVALGESNARIQGFIKMARGAGFDPARALEGAAQVATGRRIPDPRELVISAQAREIEQLRAALAAYQRRASEVALPRPEVPAAVEPFDPTAHITREQLPPVDGSQR